MELKSELQHAVTCKRPLDASACRIMSNLQKMNVDTKSVDNSLSSTWRYPLPPGITLFGEQARFVTIDLSSTSGALAGSIYVELSDHQTGNRLKQRLKLIHSPPEGYQEFDFSEDWITRFFKWEIKKTARGCTLSLLRIRLRERTRMW